jgi:predicted membrane GTPase involved in stress response
MALVIGKKNTRKIAVVAEEAGDLLKVTKHQFDVEFKILPKAEADGIRAISSDDEDMMLNAIFDAVVNVTGVNDEDGTPLVYDAQLREALIETAWVRYPICAAFWNVQHGITQPEMYKRLKQKN